MTKWADYCVSAVKYDENHDRIVFVKAYKDTGEKLVDESVYSRDTIIKAIENGTSIVTVVKSEGGKMKKGQPVIVVTIKSVKFIKTVKNTLESDNLGSLPEF